MAILNYTTKIDSDKTISEIHKILAKRGARSIMTDYDNEGVPVGLTFFIYINEEPINFRLPSNYVGVLRVMTKDKKVPKPALNKAQATRVAWRIIKDWVAAQMALIDAELAQMEQVFLPYAITETGQTVYDRMKPNMIGSLSSSTKMLE